MAVRARRLQPRTGKRSPPALFASLRSRGTRLPLGGPALRPTMPSSHDYDADQRNASIRIAIRQHATGAEFVHVARDEARVSVLDSGFMLGDGVWEGVRLHNGVLLHADKHIRRLFEGAKALE